MISADAPSSFRLAYVPGVTPAKWARVWHERLPDVPLDLVAVEPGDAMATLRGGGADAALLRLPVDGTDLSAIPLYTETTVVIVPKDHVVTAVDEVTTNDLSDELVLHPLDDTLGWDEPPGRPAVERPATTADAVELVAAGVGVLVVPQSLARLHHRKDLTYRPVLDAPASRVALSWPEAKTTDLVEEFIGIVRGRTVNSSRGRQATAPQAKDKGGAGRASSGAGQRSGAGSGARSGSGSGSGKSSAGRKPGAGSSGKGGGRSGSGGAKAAPKRGKPRRRS
ncbi:substrate-binding domain-containing protein [Yinghuangia seranimata]|uniref:substrate-binding domain-containing protein n=1 Tax=Yinghuangia seranimata TaxID=408067 RepID=UPI00248BF47D|nr:substrate-binding domain-containing protein [Yinghuangia seranimata]MDI2129956.1 substrate-binding domain-containing protein [Yinghuangia seranimata]MDI2131634.1 substrate-binding domain-containing protein [Yinghuangia seranimata]